MLRNWIRRMGRARLVALATIAVFTGGVLVETADARARGRSGGGFSRSFGNRGSRSSDTGQPGNRMQPVQNNGRPQANGVNSPNNRGSWLQRNPLMAGIMGAIAGTVIGSMLMNAMGGMGGMGGILMLLLGGLALFAVFKMFRGRQQAAVGGNVRNANFGGGSPAGGFGNSGLGNSGFGNNPGSIFGGNSGNNYDNSGDNYGGVNPGGVNTQTREQGLAAIALEDASMSNQNLQDVLTTAFFQVQEAWSNGDRRALSTLTSGDVYSEFTAELDEMDRRNERNVIKNIVMRSFEITEAWQEGDVEYVTGHINARLLDYTERNGQVVEGDAQTPTQFSEYWTFVRPRGRGNWQLSAINQQG